MSSKKGEMIAAQDNLFAAKARPAENPNALAIREDGALGFRSFRLTATAMEVTGEVKRADFDAMGRLLGQIDDALQFWIGDWLLLGEGSGYGEAKALAAAFGYKSNSVHQFKWVCRRVESSMRIETLSFTHHMMVAKLGPEQQRYWLERAATEEWSVKQLREAIHNTETPDLEIERQQAVRWVRREIGNRLAQYDRVNDRTLGMVLIEMGRELMEAED